MPSSAPQTAARPVVRESDTRAAILAAASEILLAVGIEGLSIRKVTERCGYTAPTIYHHFGDKNGLLDAVIEARFAEVLALMEQASGSGAPTLRLRAMAQAFIRFALANPNHYALLSTPRADGQTVPSAEAAREKVQAVIDELGAAGTLATQDRDAAFEVTWALLHGVISLHLMRPDYAFSEQLVDLTLDVMERGLLRPEAQGGPR